MQLQSGILIVTLQEVYLPSTLKARNVERSIRQQTYEEYCPLPSALVWALQMHMNLKLTAVSLKSTSRSCKNEVNSILKVEKSQVIVHANSGKKQSSPTDSNKFDVVSFLMDVSVFLYLKNALSALCSGGIRSVPRPMWGGS